MKAYQIFLVLVWLSLPVNAQFWATKISGNGQITTVKRNVDDFDKLTVTGPFEVKIISGNQQSLSITADENLINIIETYVKSGKLVIRINPDFNLRKYTRLSVIVPADYLSKITLTGSGTIYNEKAFDWHNLKLILTGSGEMDFLTHVNNIETSLTGSGDIKLQGTADTFTVSLTGSGDILAKGLQVKDAKITITGSGEVYVQAQDHLNVRLFGSGDVYYFGEPARLKSKSFGSGSIHLRRL